MPLDTSISLEADVHHLHEDLKRVKSALGDLEEVHNSLFPDPSLINIADNQEYATALNNITWQRSVTKTIEQILQAIHRIDEKFLHLPTDVDTQAYVRQMGTELITN